MSVPHLSTGIEMDRSLLVSTVLFFGVCLSGCVSLDQLRTNIEFTLDDKPRMNSVIVLKKKEKDS